MTSELSGLQAVLRKAGNAYDASAVDKRLLWADQVSGLVEYLGTQGISVADLAPLDDLCQALRNEAAVGDDVDIDEFMDARTGNADPSDAILARASAVIDLLILDCNSEEQAAQMVTRKLLVAGVNPPMAGGDARGYMRLAEWRQKLRQGRMSPEAAAEYERFREVIADIPLRERLNRVITDRLWDRRAAS